MTAEQPIASEHNEREAFESTFNPSRAGVYFNIDCYKPIREDGWQDAHRFNLAWDAWQHQKSCIDELTKDRADLEYKCMNRLHEIESLQAKLTIAVDFINILKVNGNHDTSRRAISILDQIKKLGE